jgi:ribosome-binding protein aMBF1 (putative translation factor)
MDDYDKRIKKLQADAVAALQKELAEAALDPDPLAAERGRFLMMLVKARLDKKLSQAGLAVRLNMQQPAIARIERGHGNPSLRTLLAMAKALDADLVLKYKH